MLAALSLLALAAPAEAATVSFPAPEATWINSNASSANYGSQDRLWSASAPTEKLFVKFYVSGLPGGATVTGVRLKLRTYSSWSSGSADAPAVRSTTNNWSEGTLTYSRWTSGAERPTDASADLADLGSVGANQAVTYTLPASAISGNGTYSFASRAETTDDTGFASDDHPTGAYRPTLEVDYREPSTPPPPPPSGQVLYGFHQDLGYYGSASYWNPRLDATRSLGATVTRGTLLWSVTEPSNDNFSWTRYDNLVAATSARGIATVFMLGHSPQWANGSADPWVIPADEVAYDRFVSEYAEFAGRVAEHFAGRGLRYEIWNEPNERYFWKGSAPSIDRYAELFTAARNAMMAADPSAKVGLGGITGLGAGCCISGRDFIAGLVARGVGFAYAGIHPYVSRLDRGPDTHVAYEQNFDDTKMIHDLLESKGRPGVKLWLTEWGWYGCSPGEQTRAAWLKRSHERIRDEWSSFVELSTYFMDRDEPGYGCAGVLRSDLSRKPLADAFQQFAATVDQ